MFLQLAHTRLDIFKESRTLVLEVYRLTKLLPSDERFAMCQQLRRAALSVHLNLAEGCSRKSVPERIRFFEISRGSIIEIDTAIDIALELSYCNPNDLEKLRPSLINCFRQLSNLIKAARQKKDSPS